MNTLLRAVAALVLGIVVLAPVAAMAQNAPAPFKPEDIDQLVAPIALHPDALLAQILMASTYPLEVVEAARFVKANASLKDAQLNEALKQHTWDDSVKSLVFFPEVLTMMSDKLDWLQKVGDAFLAQQQDLMASIQRLRTRAQAAGQLKSTPEQNVVAEPAADQGSQAPTVIRVEPANPQVVSVPSYDPTAVYGAWPPAAPPPYSPYPPGYFAAGAFTFAASVAVGAALWGDVDWRHGGDVTINNSTVNNFTRNVNNTDQARTRVENYSSGGGSGGANRAQWNHNPEHRKGAQYRDAATQQRFNKGGPPNAQAREAFRGRTGQGSDVGRAAQQGGGAGQAGARDRQGGFSRAPGEGTGDRGAAASPRTSSVEPSRSVREPGAFEGMGSGRDAQSFSNRGNASRGSFNQSSGGAAASRGSAGGTSAGRGGGGGGRAGGRR